MLNKWIGHGRVCEELVVRHTGNGAPVCSFTVAVDSDYKDKDGTYPTEFIRVVAWGKTGEFVAKYFTKGSQIIIVGRLASKKYEKQGVTVTQTEVVADNVYFAGTKKETKPAEDVEDDFFPAEEFDERDLPWEGGFNA